MHVVRTASRSGIALLGASLLALAFAGVTGAAPGRCSPAARAAVARPVAVPARRRRPARANGAGGIYGGQSVVIMAAEFGLRR
jgi:hypothetical protein